MVPTVPTVPMRDERRDGGETPRRGGEGGRRRDGEERWGGAVGRRIGGGRGGGRRVPIVLLGEGETEKRDRGFSGQETGGVDLPALEGRLAAIDPAAIDPAASAPVADVVIAFVLLELDVHRRAHLSCAEGGGARSGGTE